MAWARAICLALLLLAACGESAETAVPKLMKELQSPETSVRNRAAMKLASYGEAAKPATKALIALLGDKNGGVKSSAAYALRSIGTKEASDAIDTYNKSHPH